MLFDIDTLSNNLSAFTMPLQSFCLNRRDIKQDKTLTNWISVLVGLLLIEQLGTELKFKFFTQIDISYFLILQYFFRTARFNDFAFIKNIGAITNSKGFANIMIGN